MTAPNADSGQEQLVQLQRAPHIDRSIDNTALQSYMECPRKYLYSMVLHRRKKGLTKPALAYGTTWHAMMEAHYKTGGNHDAVLRAAYMSWQPHDNPDDHRTIERALSAYEAFLKHYGDHETETRHHGKTVGFPENPIIEAPTELWWPGALHPYTGKIDRVFENAGLYYVEDHKTSSALGPYYFRQFDPSNQMMGYAWLAQKLTGLPIAGVRINAHAVLKRENKFERQTVMFSQQRLQEWAENLNMWVARIEESMRLFNLTKVTPADEQRDRLIAFPHNFNACAGKYGACSYVDVCTMPPNVRQRVLENDFDYAPWDPMQIEGEEVAE